ncbi:MAG TPA: type II secretion system F family protein [Bryobacteraceae bacterium]|nr:type II secretion system F family protein [Bryobacteraceae bacterium]
MALSTVLLMFLGTFLVAAIAVWIARTVMERHGNPEEGREAEAPAPSFFEEESGILLRDAEVSSISPWRWLLKRSDVVERLKGNLAQADMNSSVGRITASMLLICAVSIAILNNIHWLPGWAILVIAIPITMTPYIYILHRKKKRWQQIEDQFPDAVDSMSRALRAGYPFAAALDSVANQTPNPLGRELRKTFAEGALGASWEQAMQNLAHRLPIQEVCLFTAAVQMQSKSGGNLSEVLDKLGENMREGAAIRGEVKSLSAQGRFAGYILTTLPVVITLSLLWVNPTFLNPLIEEKTGQTMLICSILGLVAAHLVIRKLVDIHL